MVDNPYVRSARFVLSATKHSQCPDLHLPEVAVAGRSNVGKSSLINRLVNRRRLAKVSGTPGRTQHLNFFIVNESFALCDLPGYGYAKAPEKVRAAWRPMVEGYLARREELAALLLLMDVRREPHQWEFDLAHWCSHYGHGLIPVATKIDKLSSSKRKPAISKMARTLGVSTGQVVGWSSMTGEGLSELWRRIQKLLGPSVQASQTEGG